MGDSVLLARVLPDAADTAFQIHCLERSAYAAVLRAFYAQSDLLSRAKEGCLTELRNELKILESEHRQCLGKARSNKQINSVRIYTADLACVLPDAGDSLFQIHCLERSAYASVLRAFCAVANHLSWLQVKLLTKVRNELRISHIEHKEVLMKASSNEYIKSLRKFSLANLSVLTKTNPSFAVCPVGHDKINSTGHASTSSTSCLSISHQSPISEHSMSGTRDIGISDSLNGSKEGPYFEPHAMVSAKRLKSVNGHAQAYLKCALSDQLPVAVSAVMVKGRTDNALDSETISCEVKSGCTSSPIFEEKHSESNVGQVPSSVEARQESGKRKANQMGLSTSLGQRRRNKDSDLEYDSEIINLCLTANLVHKVERLLSENPDPANLEKARSILKVQEKDLLDAIVKLCEVSYDAAYFSANGQADITYTHDDGKGDEEMLPKPANSSDETPPGTTRPRDGGAGNHAKIQGSSSAITTGGTASSSSIIPPLMETRPHAPVSPTSAPTSLGESSGVLYTAHPPHAPLVAVGSASGAPVPRKKRPIIKTKTIAELEQRWWMSKKRQLAKTPPLSQQLSSMTTKFTPEQRWRMWEFAHRVGWSIRKAGADAVDAFCAQVGVSQRALKKWMSNNKHLANIPPPSSPTPPLPLHHQDHPPAASPPQGSTTEQGKSPESPPQGSATEQGKSHEPEAAAPADDGGKEDKNEEASEETQQGGGKGRRSRKPSKLYSGAEWVSK